MKYNELTKRLKEYAEWAYGNEREVPICMGSDLRDAATYISDLSAENQALRNSANRFKAECAELRDQIIDLETQHRTEMCEDGYDCVELGRARTENTKLRAELDKETRARKKQAEIINELRATKYEQIEVINKLKTELEELKDCRHKCKFVCLRKEYQKVEDERDQLVAKLDYYERTVNSAIKDLNEMRKISGVGCNFCYYNEHYDRDTCLSCGYNSGDNWRWRFDDLEINFVPEPTKER